MSYKELEPVNIFIPECNQLVIIKEGSGDNLSREDREEGFVDYVYYTQYSLDNGDVEEIDGGMLLQKTYLAETYSSLRLLIGDVLDMAYDSKDTPYIRVYFISGKIFIATAYFFERKINYFSFIFRSRTNIKFFKRILIE